MVASSAAIKTILDVRDISLNLHIGKLRYYRCMLDLVLTRNQQHGKFEIRGWLRLAHLRNRALAMLTKIAKKCANDRLLENAI